MIRKLAYLAALVATPLAAQEVQTTPDVEVFIACAKDGIGGGACPTSKLAQNLGLIAAEDIKPMSSYGVEGFAMLTSLRYAASALFFIDEGEPCIAEEERTAATEIWLRWVEKPVGLPAPVAEDFDLYAALMNGIMEMEVIC